MNRVHLYLSEDSYWVLQELKVKPRFFDNLILKSNLKIKQTCDAAISKMQVHKAN